MTTPRDYGPCPGTGQPYDQAKTTPRLLHQAMGACPECGRTQGISKSGKMRRHAAKAWWERKAVKA